MNETDSTLYNIVPISKQDLNAVNRFMEEFYFKDEPLTKSVNIIESILHLPEGSRDSPVFKICIDQGTSLKAVTPNGTMIGISLNRIITRNQLEDKHVSVIDSVAVPVKKYIDSVVSWENVFNRFPDIDKILRVHFLSVSRDWRQKGIGSKFVESSRHVARKYGCQLILIHCTSAYSQKIAKNLGFECISAKCYADYLGDDGNPYFQIDGPHTGSSLFILRV